MNDTTENTMRLRRFLLSIAGAGLVFIPGLRFAAARAASGADAPIVQPDVRNHSAFVARAFEMRRQAVESGDQAFGAVVVRNGDVIGQSPSRVIVDRDPTAHAETSAIRDAARRTNSRDLSGAILYSSSRPCPMCEAAAYWAGIKQMIHGREAVKGGPPHLCP